MDFYFCDECGQRLKIPSPNQKLCDACSKSVTSSVEKSDITTIEAYRWAESIIYQHASLDVSIGLILQKCADEMPSAFWDELNRDEIRTDILNIEAWLTRAFTHPRNRPTMEIEFLCLALFDVEYGFDLVGNSKFSILNDDEDECFINDDYRFREDDPVPTMAGCLSDVMRRFSFGLMDRAAGNSRLRHVGSWFATMAYAGIVGEHFFQTAPAEILLGDRQDRWFGVGSPEGQYRIILGQRTKENWIPFTPPIDTH